MSEHPEATSQGAVHELRDDPASRKKFLRMAGAGSAAALAAFIAACGSDEKSSGGGGSSSSSSSSSSGGSSAEANKSDIEILQYALTLEHLEADFYMKAGESGMLKGAALKFGKQFGETEADHVKVISATIEKLGGKPGAAPQSKFPLKSQKAILNLAATVENLGAAAYLGQAAKIKSPEVLAAALSIHSVEARHAAALNVLTGKKPTNDGTAFAKPASMAQVLKMVKPFIVS